MASPIIKFFAYDHLKGPQQAVSEEVAALANKMEDVLPDGPEKSAGLRHLLEAKDCFVRCTLP